MSQLKECTSERGKTLLLHNNFRYYFKTALVKSGEEKWNCVNKNCLGKLYISGDSERKIVKHVEHNHESESEQKLQLLNINSQAKIKAIDNVTERPSTICQEILMTTNITNNLEISEVNKVKRNIYYARKKKMRQKNEANKMEVKRMLSEKGRDLLAINNYKYCVSTTTDFGIRWRCIKKSGRCKAKVYTSHELKIINSNMVHNHGPDKTIERQALCNSIKRKIICDIDEQPEKLIQLELQDKCNDTLTKEDIYRVRQNLWRYRRLFTSQEDEFNFVSSGNVIQNEFTPHIMQDVRTPYIMQDVRTPDIIQNQNTSDIVIKDEFPPNNVILIKEEFTPDIVDEFTPNIIKDEPTPNLVIQSSTPDLVIQNSTPENLIITPDINNPTTEIVNNTSKPKDVALHKTNKGIRRLKYTKRRTNVSLGESNGFQPVPKNFMTRAIHVGQEPEQWKSMAVIPPISMSTTFKQYGPGEFEEFEYGRSGNPTRKVLETCLANLEGGKHAMVFASGLGATTTVMSMFSAGDHVISGDDIYGGTNRLFSKVISKFGIDVSFVDTTDPKQVEQAIRPNTKLLWIETPTNPTLKVNDIKAMSEICKKNNIILAVDNSFLTPYLQRPLEFGADLVVYSLTKYMNGHSDVVMGAVITSNEDLHTKIRFLQNAAGAIPSPFDCSQVNRSLKTLGLRMRQHNANGDAVAKYLMSHPKVEKVLHPGLPSHPQHELFKKQCTGHSGMISFYHTKGLEESKKFLKALKVFTLAESLGGFESLAELPIIMTHASVPPDQCQQLGIKENLIRLSVGLEDEEDLISDLAQALATI